MSRVALVLLGLACLCISVSVAQAPGIGDRLLHTYFQWAPLPLTVQDATSAGYSPESDLLDRSGSSVGSSGATGTGSGSGSHSGTSSGSSCDPNRGISYAYGGALSSSNPVRVHLAHRAQLYFTSGGQIAGFGLRTTLAPASTLTKFWEQDGDFYILSVAFRNSSIMCTGETEDAPLGYGPVVINQGALNLGVPMTDTDAYNGQWTNGSCISKMGRHWGYDLATAPVLSGKSANLVPLLPMYTNGQLVTMLIEVPDAERVEPFGWWEGPFPGFAFCKNFCGGCSLDATLTSTMHFFLTDPTLNVCSSSC